MADKVTNLYNTFKKNGYAMESEAEFRKNLQDPKKRRAAYDALVNDGYDMEAYDQFESNIGFAKPVTPAQNATPQDNTHTTLTAETPQVEPTTEQDEQPIAPAQPAWQPTEQEKIRMSYELNQMVQDSKRRGQETVDRVKRMTDHFTPEGRKRLKAAKFQAQLAGTPTSVMGLTPPVQAPATEGQQNEGGEQTQPVKSLQSPVPYGVKIVNGKRVTEWLLPDGRLTTNLIEADQAEFAARGNRLEHQFVNRMKQNGLDPSKPQDVQQQAQMDMQAPIYKHVAELWQEAEEKHAADVEKSAKKHWDSYASMGGGREMRIVTTAADRYDREKSHLTRFDLQTMMDNTWERLGEAGQDQLIREFYATLSRQNPNDDPIAMHTMATQMARSLSDNAVYQYAVKKNTPKSTLEYFGRQVADMNLINSLSKGITRMGAGDKIGDLPAYEAAMGEYGKDHRVAQVGGTVVGMALDPTTWISGGVGSLGAKGTVNLGGRIVASRAANGMTRQVGSRLFTSSLGGRVITGAAGGATNFATYEMMKEGERQFVYGGVLNPETLEVGDYSAGDVLKAGGHGLVMGGVTGTFSPLIGNVADKTVKATTSTAGKAGVRFGEVAVSTLAEGTVFSLPEWISGEGDAFDVWTDNITMMVGFKAQHGLKSAPRVIAGLRPIKEPKTQAERNHNRQSFVERLRNSLDTSPTVLSVSTDEREELRRAGYGELADLFGKDKPMSEAKPTAKAEVGAIEVRAERVEAEEIADPNRNPDFDGYSAMERLMQDGRVSEATRAKAYYILTGRMLPMSSVVGWNTTTNEDGSIIVNSMNAQGDVVTSRVFKNKGEADAEASRIQRQAELNTVDIGEQYRQAEADGKVFEAAVNAVSPGADHATIKEIYDKVKRGDKDVTESQRALAELLDEAIDRNADAGNDIRPEAMRSEIKDETGIDVDAVLRKQPHDRTKEEQEAVQTYMERLYPEEFRDKFNDANMPDEPMPTPEQQEAQRAYEEAKLLHGRFEEGTPEEQAEARADMDAIALRYREALEGIEDAFGADAEARMAEIHENPWDLLTNPELTVDQQDAVLYYINSRAALDGVQDAADASADHKREAVTKAVDDRTHKDTGVVIPATMKVDDRQVYIVKGNVTMFEDGTGVDVRNSDQSVVILDPQKGEIEFTSPDQIFKIGEAVDPQTELANALAEVEAGRNVFPDIEPEGVSENIPTNGNNDGNNIPKNIPQPNVEEYDKGYGDAIEEAQNLSDERLDHYVDVLREGAQKQMQENGRVDDYIRGRLEALEFVQQDRAGAAVPKTEDNVPNPTEKAISDAENVSETVSTVENGQQTAIQRIPLHPETGEPMFEAVDKDTAWDGLVEAVGGEKDAVDIAMAQIEQASTDLEALKKKPPTMKAPKLKGSPMAMAQAKREANEAHQRAMADYQNQLAEAEARQRAWNNIMGVYTSRNAEKHAQEEAERRMRDAQAHDEAVARFEEEQRIKAEKQAEQEAIGTHSVNPKIKARWDSAPKLEGNPDAITLPDGSSIRGRYVLTEAGAASASHDVGNAYIPTEGFPIDENGQSVNDRDYERDKDAQRIVEQMAGAYDNRALQTPVIVSKDGVVLSGNNRTMSGDLAARQGTDKAYVDYLREFGAKYGFTPEQVQGMKNPRLVFVPDETLPYDATTFSRFNAQEMKSQSKPEAAVKLGKIVPDDVFNNIVGDIARYDRLSDYYGDEKAVAHALGALMQAGVINDKQMPEMRTGTALSAAGKELIENTLIGKVFQTSPDAVRQIISMPTLRQSIVMGLNEIAGNRTLAKQGYDLSKELGDAVDLVYRAKSAMPDVYTDGMPVSPFGRMQGLFDDEFGDSRVTDGATLLLADLLNSGKPSDIRKVLTSYNNEASSSANGQIDMFSGSIPTKEEILTNINEHFKNATPREQQALVDAAIAERKRRAEAEAEQRGGDQAGEQAADAIQRSAEPQQPTAGTESDLTPEEQAIAARVEVSEDDWTEGDENHPTYKRTIIIDGKHNAVQVDEPDADGHYTGSYFEYEGKRFGDIAEIVNHIDTPAAEPTEAQKKAGNYKMKHVRIDGYDISIENEKGSIRRGKDANGTEWESEMHNDYGYIRGTEGVDGDHIDVFLSDTPEQGDVFVVDQYNPDGSFDEHKVMYGFADGKVALDAYLANYEQGWEQTRRLDVTGVSKDEFKKWIQSSKRKTKPFKEYKNVKAVDVTEVAPSTAEKIVPATQSVLYTIVPSSYTNKAGKTTPMHSLQFTTPPTYEQRKALASFAREKTDGRKSRGWCSDKDTFSEWLFRTEEDARKAGDLIGNDEAVADAQPLSREDIKDAVQTSTDSELDYKAVDNVEDFMKAVHHDWGDTPMVHPVVAHGTMLQFVERTIINGRNRSTTQLGNTKQQRAEVDLYPSEDNMRKVAGFTRKQTALTLIDDKGKCVYDIVWHPNMKKGERSSMSVVKTYFSPAKPKKAPINRVSVEDLAESMRQKGEAKLSDHAEPIEPKQDVQITDEMEDIAKQMRDILGVDDSEVGGVHFRDPDELNPEQKRKLVMLGIDLTMRLFDQGKTDFPTVAKVMVGMVGEKIKPWIKAMYKNATIVPGYENMQFTSDAEIDRFDIANFDKPSADALKQAEMIVAERKAKEATSQAEKEVIETRNQKRKEHDKQTEADTAALGEKAEAVASKAESVAETSTDRDELNRATGEIDDTLDEVNEQLALLGYYEADLNAPEHEVYGLRRSAEKEAVKDATKLAKQLIDDLNIDVWDANLSKTDKHGRRKVKPLATSNLTGIDGDITINLPMPDGRNLHINIGLKPTHERGVEPKRGGGAWEGDNLEVDRIMYRFESKDGKGDGNNHFLNPDVTYNEMLAGIQRTAKWGMPKQEQSSAEFVKEMAERMERGESPYTVTPEVEAQLAEQRKSEAEPYDAGGYWDRHEITEPEKNGFKVGEKVWYTRNDGKGKRELATIVDFGGGADVTLDTGMAPIMYEACEWSQIEKQEPQTPQSQNIFEEAAQIAEQAKARREAKKPAPSKKKQPEVKPEQPIGDLFSGLFDEAIDNEQKTDVQSRSGSTERERGHEPQQNESLGKSQRNETERTDGRGMGGRGVSHSVSDAERSGGVSRSHESAERLEPLADGERKNSRNNHAERGTDYAPKGDEARIKANLEAIRLAKQLLESGEAATPKQMTILRKFSGWGGLGKAFNEDTYGAYNADGTTTYLRNVLTKLLGEQGFQDAIDSRRSAYYTPAEVIDTMWDIVKAMGFKGGNILEGSAGIGNILGLMPREFSDRSNIHAVEIDSTTGGILSLLYPDAKVDIQGFQDVKVRNNSIDLAITNVPFVTGLKVFDHTGDKDLSTKFHDIHDFCIAKNIRKLREGGIGIFITSSGTMDNSARLRAWISNEGNADVVGAFRMHNKTFGSTGATSDIIVVRKRVNGRVSPNAIDITDVTGVRVVEYNTEDTRKVKGQEVPIIKRMSLEFNKYFAEHPENMAGEMMFNFERGETYQPTSKALFPAKGKPQSEMLKQWASRFSDMVEEAQATESIEDTASKINEQLGEGVKEGSMALNSQGELCMARMGEAVPLGLNKNKVKGHTKAECFKAYTAIKKALSDVLEYQSTHEDNAGLEPLLKELNHAFDSFTRTYGNLHKNTAISFLRNDVDFSSILALETYSEKGDKNGNKIVRVGKTDIFTRRVIETEKEPQPTTIKDGILASLYKNGGVDVDYIADALGKPTDEVRREIVESGLGFENPANGMMEVSYQYLSGNVREKLHIAQENNEDGRYDANITALERALPMTIPAHLIEFSIGSSWIDPKLYEDFVAEKTGIKVQLTNVGGTWFMKTPWNISNEKNRAMAVVSKLCDKTIMGHELIEAAMTNRSITVSRTTKKWDGTTETITDREATNACSTKVDEIRSEFKDWARGKMQTDPEMSALIEHTYNERFNNYVPMSIPDEFVPTHFGGQVSELHGRPFALRPHQGKAVVRGTTEPVLLAHEVGTGKTFTLITTAMEMRRLGTARKPMIVVQNATVGQFVESAKEIYPNAKVLTIEEADRTAEGRKNFYAKIKYNDWDMIVVPQSVFERIPDSEERQMAYIKNIIEEKMMVLEAMRESDDTDGRNPIVRQAEKELADREAELADITKALEEKRERKQGKKRDEKKEATTRQNAEVRAMEMLDRDVDDVENFDDMGIDAILVDEAHEYKHLGFATAMQRGVKGVDPSYSKKSQGVFLKTQAVLERNHGRNVVFATGTPISNTAAEIWTFMRYLMPADTMKEYGIYYFDDFVRNFGNISQMVEFKTSGKFDEVNRFAGYVNLPELVRIWSGVSDTVLTREAGGVSDKIPDIEGGKAQDIFLPQTRALRSVMKFVKKELQRYEEMTGKEKKENSHIPLTMYGIAKAAAVDARLVISDAEDDPNSKTNAAVRETLRSLEDSKKYKGSVAIFADNYQNKRSGFNLYEDIKAKLIKAGVPEEQIVIIKSGMTIKKKLDIFEKVNAGEIRVVMGSTFTLGTGVNIQERLHTAIHVDAPNRPMDYTQRNGRILRQGNLHKDMGIPVRVLRFGVEDSLDVTAYQRLKTKGAIADSIMNGSKMMQNSMENRVLEEEEDQFGDMTAQLSGSQYAILKNQAEREVRSLTSKLKQHEIDQIYLHNSIPKEKGFIAGAERRIKIETANLETIGKHFPDGKIDKITIGKLSFDSVEAMEDFFKEQNTKKKEAADNVQGAGEAYHSTLTVNVNGLDFVVTTDIERVVSSNGQIAFDTSTSMTLECEELGIKEDVPYMRLKEAMKIIAEDIATGARSQKLLKDAQYSLSNHTEQLSQMEARYGKEFPFGKELEAAEERLEEYTEKMREEMMEKEKKYAEIDKGVEAASNVELTDEDETPSETNGDKTKFREINDDIDEYEAEPSNEKEARAVELAGKLNTPITLITSADEIGMLPTSRQRHAKGWITSGGEIVIVVPNNTDVADIENTVVHEIVGHDGLEAMIGPERMDEFVTEVYDHAGAGIKKKIDARADKEYSDDIDRMTRQKGGGVFAKAEATVEANAKKRDGHYQREATKEYMADMAGEICDKGFEKMSQEEQTLWGKIKAKVQQFLDKFLRGLKIAKSIRLTDKDLAYILYKAWKHKRENGVFAKAEDIAMRRKTGYDSDPATKFRDGGLGLEEAITKMKVEAAQANSDNLQVKRDAMRAIGGNLNHLRSAMARQREYDLTTVKSISDLAKTMLDAGLLDDLSKYETKRILGTINNVVGKQDVSQYVQKVMDIMVDNQLRMGANALGKLLTIKGSRVDARGIEVQGELDPEGVAVAKVVRKSTSLPKDEIDNLIADAIDRMSSTDTAIADEATIEYAGLQLARQFVENVTESKAEEKALRESIRQAKADKDAGQMDDAAYKQYVIATEDAIRQNKIERAEAYHELVEQVGGVMSESIERAKAWREAEKERVEAIHHNANSDMQGRPTDEHHKNDRIQKLANNSAVRFLLAPLGTFDQMLRMFGQKNVRGEGYLWNRYMRGWVDATEREYTGYRDALKRLDEKVSEVYGRNMKWGDLFTIDRKLPKANVRFWDGGEPKDHELTQGNLLYIYMADKMSDGRMKLRKMGITESDIEDIKNSLDPHFLELADWMQEEFLVEKRNEYNEVHKRMFGASMAAIENYFPLKILANARLEEVDVADDTTDTALPATSTGSIIKRRRNNLALDVTGANAFSVILDHLQQMERWAAFAEFNRDLNTLLSYKRFRNQVMNMSSMYGGGKTLWNNFRNVCSMAAGAYRPPIAALDKAAVNIAKGVTAAKVSFRVFTALKQFLSMPAYLSDSNPLYLAENIATPWKAWNWSMENLPLFEKRWTSRMAGDPRLLKSEMDWKAWRSKVVQLASRVGMSPNAFVDALTVSIGAHSMYQTKKRKYLRWGMSESDADKRAKQDATILFNQTQQSSEGAFLSTIQVDRSWLSVLFTVFRNSSMSYTRQQFDAIRNLARRLQSGYEGLSEEFMAKQMRRDGIDPDTADKEAKREYRRGIVRDLARVAVFGFILQLAWNMGAYLPYLLLGDDEEEKDKMWDDIFNHTYFGSVEGLTGGDVYSAAGQMWLNGDDNWSNLTKEMPLAGDLATIYRKMGKDNVAAMNDVVNLLAQSALGVNPQSLTDAVVAVIDACGDDANSQRECALLISRVINCPQSQLDKIYFDELGASGDEASRMTPQEIAERYARYKTRRNAPLTGWMYSDEGREKQMDKHRKKSNTLAKERLGRQTDEQTTPNIGQWIEEYNATKKRVSEIRKLKDTDEDTYYDQLADLEQTPEYERYEIVKSYKHDIDEATKEWLRSATPAQRDSLVRAIVSLKRGMVEDLNAQQ